MASFISENRENVIEEIDRDVLSGNMYVIENDESLQKYEEIHNKVKSLLTNNKLPPHTTIPPREYEPDNAKAIRNSCADLIKQIKKVNEYSKQLDTYFIHLSFALTEYDEKMSNIEYNSDHDDGVDDNKYLNASKPQEESSMDVRDKKENTNQRKPISKRAMKAIMYFSKLLRNGANIALEHNVVKGGCWRKNKKRGKRRNRSHSSSRHTLNKKKSNINIR